MIYSNIVLLKKFDQKDLLFKAKFTGYKPDYWKYINYLRSERKNDVNFMIYDKPNYCTYLISDSEKILDLIRNKFGDFEKSTEAIIFSEPTSLLKQYIGEMIAQRLRNYFNKMIVKDYNKIYNAMNYDISSINNGRIDLYKGFEFKIIELGKQIGVIINPKSIFFTHQNLRDYFDEYNEIEDMKIIQICPKTDCIYYLNPFSVCEYSKSKYLGKIGDDFFVNEDKKPSMINEDGKDAYYYIREKCLNNSLLEDIQDVSPMIDFPTDFRTYSYPLEILRKQPSTQDDRRISREIVVDPDRKYEYFEDALENINTITNENLKIIVETPLNEKSPYLDVKEFEKPKYKCGKLDNFDGNPFDLLYDKTKITYDVFQNKKFDLDLIFLTSYHISDEMISNFVKGFEKKYPCKVHYIIKEMEKNQIDEIPDNNNKNSFYIVLKDVRKSKKHIIRYLLENKKKFYSFNFNQINKKKKNLYAIIYHKNFCPFFQLRTKIQFENVVGFSIQYGKNKKIICSIVIFDRMGVLRKGFYLKETTGLNIIKKIGEILGLCDSDKTLLMVNGVVREKIKRLFETRNLTHIYVSETSIVRLFSKDENEKLMSGVKGGTAIFLNNEYYIASYDMITQGTQQTVKIKRGSCNNIEFEEIAEFCFQLSEYHIGFTGNSSKLPYPLQFSSKTIKRFKKLGINEYEFDYPIYL